MDNAFFAPYLERSTFDLTVAGDLRSRYTPWDNPPSGNPSYTYIKCGPSTGNTPIVMLMKNIPPGPLSNVEVPAVVSLAYGVIDNDSDLYASTSSNPNQYAFTWHNAPIGSGNSGTVTVNPGGQVTASFSVPTPYDYQTVVIRAQVTGTAVRVESYTPTPIDLY
jgi:hypothetical protein